MTREEQWEAKKRKRVSHLSHNRLDECYWCGVELTREITEAGTSRTCDHVVPRNRGGADAPYNRVWACWLCNQNKGDNMPSSGVLSELHIKLVPNRHHHSGQTTKYDRQRTVGLKERMRRALQKAGGKR